MTATEKTLAAAAALVAALLTGCDTLECGPGTHREGDTCAPNVQVVCGDDTVFSDGRCVLDPDRAPPDLGAPGPAADAGPMLACGPGTKREGDLCVPDGVTPVADAGPGDLDAGPASDADVGPMSDAEAEADMAAVEPDAAVEPVGCPEGRQVAAPPANCGAAVPGAYCVVGVATDFLTGCALPTDANLIIALIDPIAAAGGAGPLGVVPVGPGGTFALQSPTDAAQLAIVIDEAPMAPDDVWTRSVSGVLAGAPTPNETYVAHAFASDQATQARWNAALQLDDGALEAGGFLIGRVLTLGLNGLVPIGGARVRARNRNLLTCEAGRPCLRFFDDDPRLTGFQAVGAPATGASGGFLLIHDGGPAPLQDLFFVEGQEDAYDDLPAGANRGSGFHTALVPRAAMR